MVWLAHERVGAQQEEAQSAHGGGGGWVKQVSHFAPHALFVVKQLVRASRKQRLVLLPIADAIALALLASPRSMDTSTTTAAAAARSSAASGFRPPPTDEWDIAGASHYATRERLGGGDGHTAVELTLPPCRR